MASSAAVTLSTLPGVTAPGAKPSTPDASGSDSFADMLASVDAAMLAQGQAMAPAVQPAAAPVPEESDAGTLIETDAEGSEIPAAALPQAGARPQLPLPAAKDADKIAAKDAAKDDTAPQAANDNMNAVPMLAQPQPVAAQPDGKTAPAAIAATQPANTGAAPQAAADDAEDNAAAPQAGLAAAKDVSPKQAAAKPAKSDFKKALDDTKAAKSDTAPAQAAESGKDVKPADAKPQAADARPGDTPAQPAAHANSNTAQPDAILPAAAPANGAHNAPAAAATATAQQAAAPAPHHAPNLENLAVNIAAKAQGGAKQFDIRLDPPELGRVEVRLSIDATGKAEAHLTADQPQTLDLLRKDSTSLTQALRDAGLDVNQDGLNFSLRNQQQQAGHEQGHAHGGRAWRGSVQVQAPIETANATGASTARGLSLLDIKV